MKSILSEIKKARVLISDGGWGTFLHELGLQTGECPEAWNLSHRSDVLSIAKSYIEAGSDMILTNTFGGHPLRLKHYGLMEKAFELNKAGAEISREAAGDDHFVAGSIGPSGVIIMMGEVAPEKVYDGFRIQAEGLAEGGADAIIVETMSEIDEALLAIKAAKDSTDLEVISTFTYNRTESGHYRTMMGISPEQMADALIEAGADIIGANCGVGFEQMIEIATILHKYKPEVPLLIHANAGMPLVKHSKTIFPETPQKMSVRIDDLLQTGVNIIGGCCGTTPEHIRAFVKEIKK